MEEAQVPLPSGTVIYEHFIVETLLGKGDFGNVYLVRDQRNEQKLFALAELFNPTERDSYRFALNYISRTPLDRRILPGKQYIYNDDRLNRAYLLMNYFEDPNLEALRLRQAEQRFPLQQVLSIMTPVVDAITSLHHRHPPIIHGNIQPANIIILETTDVPVLVMLDLFNEHDSITTPLHYFAPGYGASEQYDGKFSVRTDVYGLGATYYTLLTGVVPPDALYRSTQQNNGETDPLQPVNELVPDIPLSIAEAIQRAMSINADNRFSSVEQFHREIVSSAGQSTMGLVPYTPPIALPSSALTVPAVHELKTFHTNELDNLPSMTSRQADEEPTPVPVSERPHAAHLRKPGVILILFALLIILGTGTGLWFHARSFPVAYIATMTPSLTLASPTSVSTATSVPSIYPTLASKYTGIIYDLSNNASAKMFLTNIQQKQGNINGYFAVDPSIHVSGSFRGTIDINAAKNFQFVVIDAAGNAKLFFEGVIQSTTSLSGDYYSCSSSSPLQGNRCSRASGSYGIWNVIFT